MDLRLPYYMMYPVPYTFDEMKKSERDWEYMRSMYPDVAKRILPYVQEEFDRQEYEGSMIYDEYPDKLQLRLMCRRIFDLVMREEKWEKEGEKQKKTEYTEAQIREITEILLYQELMARRENERKRNEKIVASCSGLVL